MVRLITQNLLSCPSRACAYPTNFPLTFRNVAKLEMVDAEFSEEFLRGVLSRLEWAALRKSAAEVRPYPSSHFMSHALVDGLVEAGCALCRSRCGPGRRCSSTGWSSAVAGTSSPGSRLSPDSPRLPMDRTLAEMGRKEGSASSSRRPEHSRARLFSRTPCAPRSGPFADSPFFSLSQLGNTDLPEQSPDLTQPESLSLDLLKTLHHVLLEVRSRARELLSLASCRRSVKVLTP